MYPIPTPIYHMTSGRNLRSILNNKGLLSNSAVKRLGIGYTNIAYSNVQQRRLNTDVKQPPWGNLHDYVPFYFAPRSPMLYTIHRGNVEGYEEGQEYIIYLKTTVQMIEDHGLDFVFTDGHAILDISDFFKNTEDLKHVDWDIMQEKYWGETDDDKDRPRRRQAEFLVHDFVPWTLIQEIGVINIRFKTAVERVLHDYEDITPVSIQRNWYY
ncbi:DUF4433 domain-containing protein [Robertmurraya sp.]|uniref:type II toxin-antitoxin system toxin DNA ADP-ribosyl transferase DarT n=1 Tax=Robertmurraya sp. TaxID=2837525 RepID=UPI003704698A